MSLDGFDIALSTASNTRVVIGADIHDPKQFQRFDFDFQKFSNQGKSVFASADSATPTDIQSFSIDAATLADLYQTQKRRLAIAELFQHNFETSSDMLEYLRQNGIDLNGDEPVSYSWNNRQSSVTYASLYRDDLSTATAGSNRNKATNSEKNRGTGCTKMDISEIKKATLEGTEDEIVIKRIPYGLVECEQFLLAQSRVAMTVSAVDKYELHHKNLVKMLSLYKHLILPNTNLDELQHVQVVQHLLLRDMLQHFDPSGNRNANYWHRFLNSKPPLLEAKFPDAGVTMTGYPDFAVAVQDPTLEALAGESNVNQSAAEIMATRAALVLRFLRRLETIYENKFSCFNVGSTRISTQLNRSAKLQLCTYSIARRQMLNLPQPDATVLMLSDSVSTQLIYHMNSNCRTNSFRCLPRSTCSRTFVVLTLISLFCSAQSIGNWLWTKEIQLISLRNETTSAEVTKNGLKRPNTFRESQTQNKATKGQEVSTIFSSI